MHSMAHEGSGVMDTYRVWGCPLKTFLLLFYGGMPAFTPAMFRPAGCPALLVTNESRT